MTRAPCPACGGPGPFRRVEGWRDPVEGRDYEIQECPCGLQFAQPRTPPGPDWYRRASPGHGPDSPGTASADWRYRAFFEDALPKGPLLDIGCGYGTFLRLAQGAGYVAAGIDFEESVVEAVRRSGFDRVEAVRIEDYARRDPPKVLVATLFDVVEHHPEPGELFDAVRSLLLPGGWVALTVPNAARPVFLDREALDYPPHHFTRWRPSVLGSFLRRKGFELKTLRSRPAEHWNFSEQPLRWLLNRVSPGLALPERLERERRWARAAALACLPVSLPLAWHYRRKGAFGPTLYASARRVA